MTAVAALLLAAAVLTTPPRRVRARARLHVPDGDSTERPEWLRHMSFAAIGGLAAALVVGGVGGVLAGIGTAVAVGVGLRRLSGGEPADDPLAVAAGLDLLSACLRAGLPLAAAVGAVAGTLDSAPAMRRGMERAADLLALGGDPDAVWDSLARSRGLEQVARMARRSADSGSSLAAGASELAVQTRDRAGDRALIATERAGVAVSGPLGLCFLPAFLCLGIVPVVLGLAGRVLSGGVL